MRHVRRFAWFLWLLRQPRVMSSRWTGRLDETHRPATLLEHARCSWSTSAQAEAIMDVLLTRHEDGSVARSGHSRAHRPRWPWSWRKRA